MKGKSSSQAPRIQTNEDALNFLNKFGYNQCGGHIQMQRQRMENHYVNQVLKTMTEQFQTVFQLPVTGKLDNVTVNLMDKPRCS